MMMGLFEQLLANGTMSVGLEVERHGQIDEMMLKLYT